MKISVIIPVYNEEKYILDCLDTLSQQNIDIEIIVVADGSSDKSTELVDKYIKDHKRSNIKLYQQQHLGPGAARNLGVQKSTGEILVFVDSDMVFETNFIEKLTTPIIHNKTKGTFSAEEYVLNWDNVWARCWNYNQNIINNKRIPDNYSHTAPVFRAILRSEYLRVHGFEEGIGWTDDWTLSKKLGYLSTITYAKYYHRNPANLSEVFLQSRWIGKNVFISGNMLMAMLNLIKYCFICSILIGTIKSIKYHELKFVIFRIIYDFGIFIGIIRVLIDGNRNK